jgi:hypothetical protein
MRGRNEEQDVLLQAAGRVPAETLMLYAMLSDQIQTLGTMHRMGMWHYSPDELGDWLRRQAESGRVNTKNTFMLESAMREWQLWGRATDVLIQTLEEETIVRIDRKRIIDLAMEYSRGTWSRGNLGKRVAA